ncbi:MAG: phosphatase PAP2 family protein [Bdellovibrionia bacterium]
MRLKAVFSIFLICTCFQPIFVFKDATAAEPNRWAPLTNEDYLWLGGFLGGALLTNGTAFAPFGNWRGGILFDDSVRNGLKGPTLSAREQASHLSDIGLVGLLSAPIILNAGILSNLTYSDPTGAWRIIVISLQSYAFSVFLQRTTISIANRSRPGQLECSQNNPGYYPDCGTAEGYNSFFSGHSAMAFTAAGLVCRHNESLNLIEDPLAQGLVCGGALAAATGVGLLRVVAERHYLSDVLVGGLVGFFSGYVLPTLMHRTESGKVKISLLPTATKEMSLQVSYSF